MNPDQYLQSPSLSAPSLVSDPSLVIPTAPTLDQIIFKYPGDV